MRFLGLIGFLGGAAGVVYSARAIDEHGRPADVLFAFLAPLLALVALIGLVLLFVPDFV